MAALPLETREAVADSGFEGCDVLAGVWDHTAEAGVEFARARGTDYFRDVVRVDAAAGQDRDAISSLQKEGSEDGCALQCVRSTARGEDAMCASEGAVFQRC